MVVITCKKQENRYLEFMFKGHAGYDEKGYDIVCAAVSVLFANTFNSIETFTEDKPEVERTDDIRVILPKAISDKSTLLLDAMVLGLKEIQKEYPKYVEFTVKEV